jgi:hypothetical protein
MWSRKIPEVEGWYWVKYRAHRRTIKCPAELTLFEDGTVGLRSALNTCWYAGPNHGGPALKHQAKIDRTLLFGDFIPEQAD